MKIRPFAMLREEFFKKPSYALGVSVWRARRMTSGEQMVRWNFGVHLVIFSIGVAVELTEPFLHKCIRCGKDKNITNPGCHGGIL